MTVFYNTFKVYDFRIRVLFSLLFVGVTVYVLFFFFSYNLFVTLLLSTRCMQITLHIYRVCLYTKVTINTEI